MELTELVYLCVKNVNYFDNNDVTLQQFQRDLLQNIDSYTDYSVAISNVMTPLNEAIQRLSDLEKIPYKIQEVDKSNIQNNIVTMTFNVKEVVSVANKNFRMIPFLPYGIDNVYKQIRLLTPSARQGASIVYTDRNGVEQTHQSISDGVIIEYKEEIPQFDLNDLGRSVDMRQYGINNAMCQYIVEYCQGKLEEQVDPSLANMHFTRAEQYFANLKMVKSAFVQPSVTKKYTIE